MSDAPSSDVQVKYEIDIYDHEALQIGEVMAKINEGLHKPRDLEGFRKEVIERFGLIGFNVTVTCWTTNVDGLYSFDFCFVSRCDPHNFDHARQSWEVQHDILGIDPTPGAIQPDGSIKSPSQVTGFSAPKS
jgi:hypothetical protein